MDTQQSLIEKEINALYQRALKGEKRGKLVGLIRRIIAYGLKIVAGGASLIVALNQWPDYNQACGAAAVIAIFIDSVFSNHKRLIAQVKAGYAFYFLKERVRWAHNRELDPLLKILRKESVTPEIRDNALAKIDELQQRVHTDLTNEITRIEKSLAEVDLKALEALALDNERAAEGIKP